MQSIATWTSQKNDVHIPKCHWVVVHFKYAVKEISIYGVLAPKMALIIFLVECHVKHLSITFPHRPWSQQDNKMAGLGTLLCITMAADN